MNSASIYLVLDMENDLIHEDGPNGKAPFGLQAKERGIIGKTREAIRKARAAGLRIGYVRVGFSPDYRECPDTSPAFTAARKNGLFKLGTWGTEIHPDLAPEPSDFQIVKHRVSPFYGTDLEPILRARHPPHLCLGRLDERRGAGRRARRARSRLRNRAPRGLLQCDVAKRARVRGRWPQALLHRHHQHRG